ncbi:MAG: hypothetical protein Q7R81_03440 [Candidatus Peregrinibacteria bacterium]|nr:hypothetical protein [Candidatus Peregrinibacteria bacterium]
METSLHPSGNDQAIGDLLLQGAVWAKVEDMIRLGFPTVGIAKMLLDECPEIAAHYQQNSRAADSLARLIRYHSQKRISMEERFGYAKMRAYLERAADGIDVLQSMKNTIEVQQERCGRACLLENKIGIPSEMAGRELERLVTMLFKLGQIFTAAGLVSYLQAPKPPMDGARSVASQERKGRFERALGRYLEDHPGVTAARAMEDLTGITDITRGAPNSH